MLRPCPFLFCRAQLGVGLAIALAAAGCGAPSEPSGPRRGIVAPFDGPVDAGPPEPASNAELGPGSAEEPNLRIRVDGSDSDRSLAAGFGGQFRQCLPVPAKASGSLVVSAWVDANGTVEKTAATATGIESEEARCLEAVVTRISFESGASRKVVFNLVHAAQEKK